VPRGRQARPTLTAHRAMTPYRALSAICSRLEIPARTRHAVHPTLLSLMRPLHHVGFARASSYTEGVDAKIQDARTRWSAWTTSSVADARLPHRARARFPWRRVAQHVPAGALLLHARSNPRSASGQQAQNRERPGLRGGMLRPPAAMCAMCWNRGFHNGSCDPSKPEDSVLGHSAMAILPGA
jgi:hypothetical protein